MCETDILKVVTNFVYNKQLLVILECQQRQRQQQQNKQNLQTTAQSNYDYNYVEIRSNHNGD